MFKRLEVNNFKSLVKFSVDLSPMTVIIGNNASGKSTVLQALDFLCNSVREDFAIIIERRDWKVENIKSKLNNASNRISFESEIVLRGTEQEENTYIWSMVINAFSGKNQMVLSSEKIVKKDSGDILLEYTAGKGGFIQGNGSVSEISPSFRMKASVLKMIENTEEVQSDICRIRDFLVCSSSFELLSPSEMRLSSRGDVDTIGMSGKNLPSFIKKMNEEKKKRFMDKLCRLFGERILDVEAQTKGKPGWTQIHVKESYKNKDISISSKELSDGMLRVLAFIAISEMSQSEAVMLLDEIENGININYAEALLEILSGIYEETGRQLILTTHSTVFLDYVDKDSIVYLYRNEDGEARAVRLFGTKEMQEQLEYMWPGEVILNMSQKDILDKLLEE